MSIRTTLLATGVTALGIAAGVAHRLDSARRHDLSGDAGRGLCTPHHLPMGSHPQSVCRWRP